MAEAGDKGIPLEDYIKLHEPEEKDDGSRQKA